MITGNIRKITGGLRLATYLLMLNYFIPCEMGGGIKVSQSSGEADLPSSFKLSSGIERVHDIGIPVNMFCNVPEKLPLNIETCEWFSPDSKHYNVKGDKVYVGEAGEDDAQNFLVDNSITVNLQDVKNCNITINKINENQLGNWMCKIQFQANFSSNENFPSDQYLTSTLTAKKDIRVRDVRLPVHMRPKHYRVFLIPFLKESNFTIKGRVEIDILFNKTSTISQDARSVTLHIKDMHIFPNLVHLLDENKVENPVVGQGYDPEREFYTVYFRNLIENDFTITMEFVGKLNNDMAGFYRSTYKDIRTGETKYIATTQMEPTDARRALPCFDEPNMKATFQINLGRVKNMSSISNMPIQVEGKPMLEDDEYVWDEYQTTLKMSTYLLAFVVSDFEYSEGNKTSNNVTFRIWSRESALEQTKYATSIGPKVLEYYEKYFNIEYPLPKQDMIAIPDFSAGAMENWGLITYRETALLYEPGISSLMNKQYVALVVAHELAHQWFGDLVTMNWWTE